ncbi:uncharacterized protein LOC128234262 isoform X3 [Mya arenaria]|uniref:uncharacterized protein LOC128234262 isoform X3 n=1 Tax=Mya arenaria TaxID=6604 RepID=UPI0022E39454|nr:uncharacterized protein LOC128234262 isoform X3 [Mya arenaria]
MHVWTKYQYFLNHRGTTLRNMIPMMEVTIKKILFYMLLPFFANTISGDVNLTASGNFSGSIYVVQTGSSVTLTCSNSDKATSVTIADKDGTVLGSCSVFMGVFTCTPPTSYTVDASDASVNYFRYVLSSFQISHCGTYKCALGTDSSVSSSVTVEHEVYYDDPCGSTCGTCKVNTFECQANKCVCKGGTIPDPDDSTNCITVPSTTSPPVFYKKYYGKAVAVLVVLLLVVIFVLVVLTWILCGGTKKISGKDFIWKVLYGVGVLDLVVVCVACGIHVHINTGDRDGALMPWYVIVAIVLTSLEVVALAVFVLKKCSGKEKTEAENEDEELKVKSMTTGNTRDCERPSKGNPKVAGVNASNHPPKDTHSEGSVVSKTDICLESDRTSKVTMRAQPLPPVGAKGHGRGLSANYEDGMDDMPVVIQKKSLPPIEGTGGEDAERRKRKKKKKKNKGNDDMELSNRSDKSD